MSESIPEASFMPSEPSSKAKKPRYKKYKITNDALDNLAVRLVAAARSSLTRDELLLALGLANGATSLEKTTVVKDDTAALSEAHSRGFLQLSSSNVQRVSLCEASDQIETLDDSDSSTEQLSGRCDYDMTQACVRVLVLDSTDGRRNRVSKARAQVEDKDEDERRYFMKDVLSREAAIIRFEAYAVANWLDHYRTAQVSSEDKVNADVLNIFDKDSFAFGKCFHDGPNARGTAGILFGDLETVTRKMVISYLGLDKVLKYHLTQHGSGDINDQAAFTQRTALAFASEAGHEACASILLEAGADRSIADNRGLTPLDVSACKLNFSPSMTSLFYSDADAAESGRDLGAALWHTISRAGCHAPNRNVHAAVSHLLSKGADVDVAVSDGYTALHWAVARQRPAIVDLLLKHGAKVDARNETGETPLIRNMKFLNGRNSTYPTREAGLVIYEKTMRTLLEAGADAEAQDHLGRTPLSYALCDEPPFARIAHDMLVQHGANIYRTDFDGCTPLFWTVKGSHPTLGVGRPENVLNIINMVIEHHDAPYIPRDAKGRSPLWHVRRDIIHQIDLARHLSTAKGEYKAWSQHFQKPAYQHHLDESATAQETQSPTELVIHDEWIESVKGGHLDRIQQIKENFDKLAEVLLPYIYPPAPNAQTATPQRPEIKSKI